MNKMKEIRIEKVTLSIGTGEAGAKLDKALKLLNSIADQKPISTKAKKRIPTWGIRLGLTIGAKVTLRKDQEATFKRMLEAIGNKIDPKKIGPGTISFGVPEYITVPDTKYDIEIGMIGLGVTATLERPGFRVKKRKLQQRKLPASHLITKEETIEFLKSKFGTEVGAE
ncbi:MAG: 50S ribosomal protein L5 [Nanoarchaeota archaeon]|jgi:large subunit ribosomal protein L5|nr:50S ribosomal protein L5 [Nanoarchaeota archaeon]|tara:strand:- start:25606 stop:26112 length:507 start_codon:yes stop_codon:yes gene_type:complete